MEKGRELQKKDFILEGLDCANCAMKIERGVSTIEGVDDCRSILRHKHCLWSSVKKQKQLLQRTEKTINDD